MTAAPFSACPRFQPKGVIAVRLAMVIARP
jgi:hypothetical protein